MRLGGQLAASARCADAAVNLRVFMGSSGLSGWLSSYPVSYHSAEVDPRSNSYVAVRALFLSSCLQGVTSVLSRIVTRVILDIVLPLYSHV